MMRDMTSLFTEAIQIMMMYAYHILCALCLHVQFYKGCTSAFVKKPIVLRYKDLYGIILIVQNGLKSFTNFSEFCVMPSSKKTKQNKTPTKKIVK